MSLAIETRSLTRFCDDSCAVRQVNLQVARGSLRMGNYVLVTKEPTPDTLMLTWDVIVLVFLFAWLIGLVTELQRSELLSLDRLLHLPLSLSGAFVLNYVSSLLSLPVIVFLPGMLGLALACIVA